MRKIPYKFLIIVPLLLIFCGSASNQAVLVANWGKFPVMLNEYQVNKIYAVRHDMEDAGFSALNSSVRLNKPQIDKNDQFIDGVHSIMGHNSRLKFLADWINLQTMIASPGDMLIFLGSWLFAFTPFIWIALILRDVARPLEGGR